MLINYYFPYSLFLLDFNFYTRGLDRADDDSAGCCLVLSFCCQLSEMPSVLHILYKKVGEISTVCCDSECRLQFN